MTDNLISRAQVLIAQHRYQEATELLKNVLSSEPNNITTLAMLSEVHLHLDNADAADQLIDSAIALSPDYAALYYIKARVCLRKDQYDDAENWLKNAIGLDPFDADFFALWASVKLTRKQYAEALELANKSLELDSENILGLNTRSSALVKLNRKEEAFDTIKGALAKDPDNAYTHASYGWGLLEKGDNKRALEHFKEALKLDPNFKYAQSGMAEALKARYLFYRLFLQFGFWMGNLTAKYQWGVLIGFYVGFRVLRSIADNNETLQPYLTPIIILLALFAFSTWIITPVSNLFLRLNVYGKYLLEKKEIMSSNFVGLSLIVCLIGVIAYLVLSEPMWLTVAVFGIAMMIPYSVMFSPAKRKNLLLFYAIGMSLAGVLAIATSFVTGEIFNWLTVLFIISFVAFQWVANFVMIKQSNV